ncbi:MAG: hypothetical protein WDM96_17875 [Lacunisphaera sp.]
MKAPPLRAGSGRPAARVRRAAALVASVNRYARRFDCRVFTRFVNPPGSLFRRWLKQKCCAPGSADTELLIAPPGGDLVFDKTAYGFLPRRTPATAAARHPKSHGLRRGHGRLRARLMFSLFDAGIVCRAKARYCWSFHRAAPRRPENHGVAV